MFRFPLQRVLDLRERQQRDAAAALASAQDTLEAARRTESAIVSARTALAIRGSAPEHGGAPIGELRTTAYLLARLDEQVRVAAVASEHAAAAVVAREQALRVAYRDRRALDRLRERHQAAWQAGTIAADRQEMDEIALSRFTLRTVRPSSRA